jgi:hypothetical protein
MCKLLDDPSVLAIIVIKRLAPWISCTPSAGQDMGFAWWILSLAVFEEVEVYRSRVRRE